MILCHGQDKLGEAEAMHHWWALAGKERAVAELLVGKDANGLSKSNETIEYILEANIRLPLSLQRDEAMEVIHGILKDYTEASVEVQEAASNPAAACEHDHPMVEILARKAEEVTGKKPLAIPWLGATDCKFWRHKDVPAYVFGVSPESMAAVDESVFVEECIAVVKAHALAA
jgi:succinyl-diaminopimelate desuccinylase